MLWIQSLAFSLRVGMSYWTGKPQYSWHPCTNQFISAHSPIRTNREHQLKGKASTIDLLTMVACLLTKVNNFFQYKKQLVSTSSYKEVNGPEPFSPSVSLPWNELYLYFCSKCWSLFRLLWGPCFQKSQTRKVFLNPGCSSIGKKNKIYELLKQHIRSKWTIISF